MAVGKSSLGASMMELSVSVHPTGLNDGLLQVGESETDKCCGNPMSSMSSGYHGEVQDNGGRIRHLPFFCSGHPMVHPGSSKCLIQ